MAFLIFYFSFYFFVPSICKVSMTDLYFIPLLGIIFVRLYEIMVIFHKILQEVRLMATINDIAERLGISKSTVSKG